MYLVAQAVAQLGADFPQVVALFLELLYHSAVLLVTVLLTVAKPAEDSYALERTIPVDFAVRNVRRLVLAG